MVDLGWHLSVQQALNRLVPQEVQAQGLYVYLSPDRAPPSTTGPAFAMFPHGLDAEQVGARPTVAKAVLVSEHILGLAPHGPVLGYHQDGGLWTGTCQSLPPGGVAWRRNMADLLDEFVAEHVTRFLGALSDPADCAVLFEESTASLLSAPDRIAVRCLAEHVTISSDHHDQAPIARPFTLAEAARFLWQTARAAKFSPGVPWPEGCAAVSSPAVRGLLRLRAGVARCRSFIGAIRRRWRATGLSQPSNPRI